MKRGFFIEKKGKEKRDQQNFKGKYRKGKYPPCPQCKKTNHTENYCWYRPGIQYKVYKQFGYFEKVCPSNINNKPHTQSAQVTEGVEGAEIEEEN